MTTDVDRPAEGYTVRDAARIIGRSERLVRKLAGEGRLDVIGDDPLRVSAESVHRERNARKERPAAPETPAVATAEQLETIVTRAVAAAVAEIMPRMLESRDATEKRLTDEVARLAVELQRTRDDLEAERQRAQAEREAAALAPPSPESAPKRRWFGR